MICLSKTRESVSMSEIFYDGLNLSLKAGTGVATYARNLISTAHDLGYSTSVLYSSRSGVPKNPLLRQIALYDDGVASRPSLPQVVSNALSGIVAAPFGASPIPVKDTSVVAPANRSLDRRVSGAYLMKDAYVRASQHFKRYGKRLPLEIESRPALGHFTYPIPMRVRKIANIYTIHDLVPLIFPALTADDKRFYYSLLKDICRRADHIVTVSEASRRDIVKIFNVPEARVTNTYQAVSMPPAALAKSEAEVANEISGLFGLDWRDYFLFVGAIEPKKNILRLIEAYLAAKVSQPLVLIGAPGWSGDKERALADDPRFGYYSYQRDVIAPRRHIRRFEYVSHSHLVSLIRGARGVLFPSLYEGFGLPVLEAMSLSTPVLSSTSGSIPEIAGSAALLVDPYDTDAITRGIQTLSQDEDRWTELAALGTIQAEKFSTSVYRSKIEDLYKKYT